MTTLDLGVTLRSAGTRLIDLWDRFGIWLKGFMPTGLYARSLLIIVTPMVILQSVVAFVFMERHWNTVTYRLSAAVTQDIAALIDVYRIYPQDADQQTLRRIAQERLGLVVDSICRRPGPNRSSRCSIRRCRRRSASRSSGRSGSIRSAAPRWSRSASFSTTR
jgi:hypothetical protein